VEKLTV
jgi:hypothetical protein